MASKSELRLIRPTPWRNVVYSIVIVLIILPLAGLVLRAPVGVNYVLFALVMLVFFMALLLMFSSLDPLVMHRGEWAKQAKFTFVHSPGHRLNVLVSGVGVGPEVYTGVPIGDAPIGEEPEASSYAAVFRANGEALLLVGLPVVYDEAVFFEQLYQAVAKSKYGLVTLHLHSMSALMLDSFIFWMYENHSAWRFHVEAVHLISPAFRLRRFQKLLVLVFRPYMGGFILQWLWDHGLNRIIWAENPIDKGQCDDDDRSEVYELIRSKMDTLNVDLLLSNMSVMFRGRRLSRRRETPPFKLMVTEVSTDECVDPDANRKLLDERFDDCVEYKLIPGNEAQVGHHGTIAEFGPRVYQDAARWFIRLRDESSSRA